MHFLKLLILKLTGADKILKDKELEIAALSDALHEYEQSLAESDVTIADLLQTIERERHQAQALTSLKLETKTEQLFQELSGSVVQLVTQSHLLNSGKQDVRVTDVLAVANRMISSLEDEGLDLLGKPGDLCDYDERHHESLSRKESIQPGQPIELKLPGVTFKERVIRKAMVASVQRGEPSS